MTLEEFNKLVESRKPVTIYKGITPLSLLGVAFIILKLLGYITWSWVWVLAPFWIPIGLVLIILFICLGVLVILASKKSLTVNTKAKKKEEKVEEKKDETPKKKVTSKKTKKNGGESKEQNDKSYT